MAEVTKKRKLNKPTTCTLDRYFNKKPNLGQQSECATAKVVKENTSDCTPTLPNSDERKCGKGLSEKRWTEIRGENLNVDHKMIYSGSEANSLLMRCERELSYFEGDLAKVQIFGKWMDIPRKQVAHGDAGLTYSFSGNTIPARPWTPLLRDIRDHVATLSGCQYNFVLINRYSCGSDYMGEHKDDEKDLSPGHPIASLSLGQTRDFVFKHQDKKRGSRQVDTVTVQLRSGMLLLMKHPTNSFWYHALPKRAAAHGVRINMTFRKMVPSKCKPISSCKKQNK